MEQILVIKQRYYSNDTTGHYHGSLIWTLKPLYQKMTSMLQNRNPWIHPPRKLETGGSIASALFWTIIQTIQVCVRYWNPKYVVVMVKTFLPMQPVDSTECSINWIRESVEHTLESMMYKCHRTPSNKVTGKQHKQWGEMMSKLDEDRTYIVHGSQTR